jgi:hypothetical protein
MEQMALFISCHAWSELLCDATVAEYYTETTKHEIVMHGYLGMIYGVPLYTDGFCWEGLQVTSQCEEVFFVPIEKAKYFADPYQPLLKGGQEADGEEIIRVMGTQLNKEDFARELDKKARQLVVTKRAELETYMKFSTMQEAIDYVRTHDPASRLNTKIPQSRG